MGLIRVLLALSVVVWHIGGQHMKLLNAAVAVLLFFMISGFYMALVVNEKYAPSGAGWVKRFYLGRFLRLYPTYWAACMLTIAAVWNGPPTAFTTRLPVTVGEQITLAGMIIGIVGQDLYEFMNHITAAPVRALFSPGFFNSGFLLIGQAWSLSSELFFYALVPLLVRSPLRIACAMAASLTVRFSFVANGFTTGDWCYFFFPATLCMFTMGSLSYSLYRRVSAWRWAVPIGRALTVAMIAWVVTVSAVYSFALPVDGTNSLDQPRFWIAYLAFAAALPFIFCATRHSSIDRMIGELSYPLYLIHGLGILGVSILYADLGLQPVGPVYILTVISAGVLAAILLRVCVEMPAERYLLSLFKARRRRRAPSGNDLKVAEVSLPVQR